MARRWAAAVLGAAVVAVTAAAAIACNDPASATNPNGAPPGSGCGKGTTIGLQDPAACRNNDRLPGCFVCVRIANDAGTPGACEVPCRLGGTDCPAGQSCASTLIDPAFGSTWIGCDSYGTDVNGTIGFCR